MLAVGAGRDCSDNYIFFSCLSFFFLFPSVWNGWMGNLSGLVLFNIILVISGR